MFCRASKRVLCVYVEEKERFRSGCCTSIVNIEFGGSWVGEWWGSVSSFSFDAYTYITFSFCWTAYSMCQQALLLKTKNTGNTMYISCSFLLSDYLSLSHTHTHTHTHIHTINTSTTHMNTCAIECEVTLSWWLFRSQGACATLSCVLWREERKSCVYWDAIASLQLWALHRISDTKRPQKYHRLNHKHWQRDRGSWDAESVNSF